MRVLAQEKGVFDRTKCHLKISGSWSQSEPTQIQSRTRHVTLKFPYNDAVVKTDREHDCY